MPKKETKQEVNLEKLIAKAVAKAITPIAIKVEQLIAEKEVPTVKPVKDASFVPDPNSYPIPTDYIQIINDVLNKKFGIKVEPFADKPAFMVTFIVPSEYSSLTEKEKEMIKIDLRSKVVSYADGVNGVREWANRVYNSFNSEIKAKIIADRFIN